MSDIITMQRYELKYVAAKNQITAFKQRLADYMETDQYGLTTIASLYYDTPDRRLIRTSVENPPFKEKIRLRSYGLAKENSKVFLELKRKSQGIVYKRRISSTQQEAENFFAFKSDVCADGQIAKEITCFRDYYKTLVPSCLIIYDRTAYVEKNGDLRLTIDQNPRYRTERLNLYSDMQGTPLLEEGKAIIEIKVQTAVPLWLAKILSDLKIYKTSMSKYGEAYKRQTQKN